MSSPTTPPESSEPAPTSPRPTARDLHCRRRRRRDGGQPAVKAVLAASSRSAPSVPGRCWAALVAAVMPWRAACLAAAPDTRRSVEVGAVHDGGQAAECRRCRGQSELAAGLRDRGRGLLGWGGAVDQVHRQRHRGGDAPTGEREPDDHRRDATTGNVGAGLHESSGDGDQHATTTASRLFD
jgi:hypothetical protein